MRQIQKRNEPRLLTEWRAAHQNDPNFGYGLIGADLGLKIRRALVVEQGALCAYTGRRISEHTSHIEHLKPQARCQDGEDVSYANMVACVPKPNNEEQLPYGAHKKGAWPNATEAHLFVSPLGPGCGARFSFTFRGDVKPTSATDVAAAETIKRLGLDHEILVKFRQAAIDATLRARGGGPASLNIKSARKRIETLERAERNNAMLEEFCFVLQHALRKHIQRLEEMRAKRAQHR
jgi:uncharacterized protein (TIGR02646 family)